jgi:hypothetical protein
VLQRPVEPAAQSGRSSARDFPEIVINNPDGARSEFSTIVMGSFRDGGRPAQMAICQYSWSKRSRERFWPERSRVLIRTDDSANCSPATIPAAAAFAEDLMPFVRH